MAVAAIGDRLEAMVSARAARAAGGSCRPKGSLYDHESLKALATEHDVPIASAKAEMVARLAKAGVQPEGVPRTPRSTPRRPRSMDTGAAENADAADTNTNANTNANANANAPPALKKAVSSSASLDQPAAAASSARPTKIKGTGIRSSRTATAS